MILVPCDVKAVKEAFGFKGTKNYDIIMEFVDGNHECVKVEGWTHTTAYSCAASLNKSIKTFNKGGIKAVSHRNEVYLVRTN